MSYLPLFSLALGWALTSTAEAAPCAKVVRSAPLTLPAHTAWVRWTFAEPGTELRFEVEIRDDPGDTVGLYFAPFNGQIDGTAFYFGIQTNVFRPGADPVGKGFLFSRWNSLDADDTRVAPGGFHEIGTHEGQFVGVRKALTWTTGHYSLLLRRTDADGPADWFALEVIHEGVVTSLGALRFPRVNPEVRATIAPSGTSFTEVYSAVDDVGAVPRWSLGIAATLDGASPQTAISDYPAWPTAEFPNVDVSAAEGMVEMAFGGRTRRCQPAGPLVLPTSALRP